MCLLGSCRKSSSPTKNLRPVMAATLQVEPEDFRTSNKGRTYRIDAVYRLQLIPDKEPCESSQHVARQAIDTPSRLCNYIRA